MSVDRLLASASVSLPGVVLLVPTGRTLARGGDLATAGVAAVGALVGLALVAGGGLLYRSGVADGDTLRVAGWNLFGLGVLGAVFTVPFLLGLFRAPPAFVATAVGVSTLAHVLIGVTDVRRLRAERAAARRSTMATLARRFVPAAREEAAGLRGAAGLLAETATDRTAALAGETRAEAAALAAVTDLADGVRAVTERTSGDRPTSDLAALVESAAEDAREAHPDAEVAVEVPDGVPVAAGEELTAAVAVALADVLVGHDSAGASASAGQETVELRVGPAAAFDGGVGETSGTADEVDLPTGFCRWGIERVATAAGGSAEFDGPGVAPVRLRLERAAGPA